MTKGTTKRPRAVLIAGPTASGKSRLALALAERLGGVVINADSMQIYQELRILTARPSADEEARVPHRLYGVISGAEPFSVARWLAMAEVAIGEVEEAGRLPILVGGTGLYFAALTEGLADIPPIPDLIREGVRGVPPALLHPMLQAEDPVMAARLRPTDRQRLARALEVVRSTGRSLADWQAAEVDPPLALADVVPLVLTPPRAALYAAIDRRVLAMLEAGALEEVKALDALALPKGALALKALGLAPLRAFLAGTLSRDAAIRAAQTDSRHYAKRQLTWFRSRMIAWNSINKQYSESLLSDILALVTNWD